MKAIFDTSSFLSLVRYYLPNDKKGVLLAALKQKIGDGTILVLDEILKECRFVSGSLVIKHIPFLNDKKFCTTFKIGEKTEFLIPHNPNKFYRMVDNQFTVRALTTKLSEPEYQAVKNDFIKTGDFKMVVKAYNLKNAGESVALVTEETSTPNDKKYFHKIPKICEILEIKTMNIQQYLEKMDGIAIEIN